MNINSAFPGTYLKAADLQGKRVSGVIREVLMEKVGEDQKPVVYFEGKERGLALNKTNSKMIEKIVGSPETEDWTGKRIVMYPTEVDYQGKQVEAIRIDWPADTRPKKAEVDDDSISF